MPTTDSLPPDSLPFYQWDSLVSPMPVDEVSTGIPLDSIFPVREAVDTLIRPSLFEGHSFAPQSPELLPRLADGAPWWLFPVLLLLCALTLLCYSSHKMKFADLAQALVSRRDMDRLLRDANLTRATQFVPMGLLIAACTSLAVWHIALSHTGILGYLILTVALVAAYMTRNGILRVISNVFDQPAAINTYLTSNYLYHLMLTTCLLPLLFVLVYFQQGAHITVWIIVGLIALLFAMRVGRGCKLFLTISQSHGIYIFYYLCIVEIVPILVLLKWISTQ